MTWDDQNPGVASVRSVAAARENARSIREVVSLEAWEAVTSSTSGCGSPRARAE